jgi:hypothetical protein
VSIGPLYGGGELKLKIEKCKLQIGFRRAEIERWQITLDRRRIWTTDNSPETRGKLSYFRTLSGELLALATVPFSGAVGR